MKQQCGLFPVQLPRMNEGPEVLRGSAIWLNGQYFQNMATLGKGMYCTVLQVQRFSDGQEFALKVSNDTRYHVDLLREYTLQKEASKVTKYVLEPLEYDESAVFEKVEGYSIPAQFKTILLPIVKAGLMDQMRLYGKLNEESIKYYVAELLIAFDEMDASASIYHHDPNLFNIHLTPEGHTVLLDFGHAKSPFWNPALGIYERRALSAEDEAGIRESHLVNLLYLGNIISHMLTGWREDTTETWPAEVYKSFLTASPHIYNGANVSGLCSPEMKDFIMALRTMRVFDYAHRGSIRSHPWLSGVEWDAIAEGRVRPPYLP